MKKINIVTLLTSFAIIAGIMLVIATGGAFALSHGVMKVFKASFPFFAVLALIVSVIIWALRLSWGGSSSKASDTFDEGLVKNEFKQYVTFQANDGFLAIDGVDGRVGYVANLNPKQFQIARADQISEVKSDYIRAPFGGTSGVYFSFKFNGKVTKNYTYLTNGNASLKSEAVMDAIAKADYYAEILSQFSGARA